MRYLLLSVLVVCVIGVMVIPSAFANHDIDYETYIDPENRFSIDYPSGWIQLGGEVIVFVDGVGTLDASNIGIYHQDSLKNPNTGSSKDEAYLNWIGLVSKGMCDAATYDNVGYICSNYVVKETKTLDIDGTKAYLVKSSAQRAFEDSRVVSGSGVETTPFASQGVLIPAEDYDWIIYLQCNADGNAKSRWNCLNEDETFLHMIKSFRSPALEPVAEPEPVTYTTDETGADLSSLTENSGADLSSLTENSGADLSSLTENYSNFIPSGVKSPAPNFENNFKGDDLYGVPYTYFDGEDGLTIGELYSYWDRGLYEEQDGDFIKIVSGDGKDLLVWYATLDCSHCNLADEVHPQDFKMYDGKDRKFTPIHSSIWGGLQGVVENPNFSWSEACSPWPVTVQPGVIDKIELCFEIPKNSDHFKFTGYAYGETQVWALFDKSTIGKTDSERSKELQELYDAVEESQSGGGCLIATAAFGSEMAPQVQMLREIRDNTVLQTESGSAFMTGFNQFYYSFSPAIADYERENPAFKEAVKITLTPLLSSLTLLQYADIDSESEMLGYGIGVILLNIGMYFVAPAVLIMAVRKRI